MSSIDNPRAYMNKSSNGPEELERIYRERFGAFREYRQMVWKTLGGPVLLSIVSPDATVLDLGCGRGEFINNIQCKKKYGMDLNPDSRQ